MKMTVTVLVKLVIIVISVLQLIGESATNNSPYSNNIGEELDQEPVEPVEYLPSLHDITECVYVRHFGPYGGNISCPDTAAALTTIQTKRVGQPSGVGPSNQHLPNTKWSMQCECPYWSHQPEGNPSPTRVANAHPRSTWRPFTTTLHHTNTSFNCNHNEFLSGLAYQYNQQSGNVSWWGRCTRFRGYFIRGSESCHNSAWRLPDGVDNWHTMTRPMTALHGVEDYPIPQSSNSQLPSSGTSDNRREKKFQECTVSPIPGCDNPTIIHGSTTLLPSLTAPTTDDLESGGGRTKHGDSLQVSCNTGYYIYGPSIATCQINGSWTQLPTCKPCRPIRNCLSVECRHRNESFCLECKAHTDELYYHIPLKFVLNKNRRRCRIAPHIDRRKVPSEPVTFNKHSSTVRLDCPSVGRPAPTIKWTRNNRRLTSLTTNEERFHLYFQNLYSNGSLVLRYVHDGDSGVYTCTAINDVGSDSVNITLISKEAQLRQELEGNSSLSAPVIHSKGPFMVFFQSNTLLSVDCNVTGNPQPTIKWYKLGVMEDEVCSFRVPQYMNLRIKQFGNGTLSFANIFDPVDVGIYSCLATNKYGSDVMHKYFCAGNSRDDCDPQQMR